MEKSENMGSINPLRPIIYWKMTQFILPGTVTGIDNRRCRDGEHSGGDLAEVHGETVKNYPALNQLVSGRR